MRCEFNISNSKGGLPALEQRSRVVTYVDMLMKTRIVNEGTKSGSLFGFLGFRDTEFEAEVEIRMLN